MIGTITINNILSSSSAVETTNKISDFCLNYYVIGTLESLTLPDLVLFL